MGKPHAATSPLSRTLASCAVDADAVLAIRRRKRIEVSSKEYRWRSKVDRWAPDPNRRANDACPRAFPGHGIALSLSERKRVRIAFVRRFRLPRPPSRDEMLWPAIYLTVATALSAIPDLEEVTGFHAVEVALLLASFRRMTIAGRQVGRGGSRIADAVVWIPVIVSPVLLLHFPPVEVSLASGAAVLALMGLWIATRPVENRDLQREACRSRGICACRAPDSTLIGIAAKQRSWQFGPSFGPTSARQPRSCHRSFGSGSPSPLSL